MDRNTAVIVGAGPAGLTAAHELLERTNLRVVVLERGDYLGGISRTVDYKGTRMDIGGHRFFSKVDRVVNWWHDMMTRSSPFGAEELARIGMIERGSLLDGTVVRVDKSYPAYFGTYDELATVRRFADGIDNLHLVGRNGMHRYDKQDHSMLTAMTPVDNIVSGRRDKSNIWDVNTEQEHHEQT